jgi:hypothetical protein
MIKMAKWYYTRQSSQQRLRQMKRSFTMRRLSHHIVGAALGASALAIAPVLAFGPTADASTAASSQSASSPPVNVTAPYEDGVTPGAGLTDPFEDGVTPPAGVTNPFEDS